MPVVCHEKNALPESDSLRRRRNPTGSPDRAQLSPEVPEVSYRPVSRKPTVAPTATETVRLFGT